MKKGSAKPSSSTNPKESKEYRNLKALVETRANQVFDSDRPVFNAADILGISINSETPSSGPDPAKTSFQPSESTTVSQVPVEFTTPEEVTESTDPPSSAQPITATLPKKPTQFYSEIPIENIQPGKYQPRQDFDLEAQQDLVQSIKTNGLLNPILVREVSDQKFEIIAGERRWRACRELQFSTISAIIQHRNDEGAAIQSLLDNIVRDDLSSYEQAIGMQRLITEFGIRKMDIADKLGFSRPRISQLLSILELPESILHLMFKGKTGLTESHARVLLPIKDNLMRLERLVRDAIAKGWSCEKLRAEVDRQPRTNAGAQAVRLQYRGLEGTKGFQLQIRYHPNRSHDKHLVQKALQDALQYLETGRAPISPSLSE